MNSQEYRNLQEAYLNVYQEEVLDEGMDMKDFKAHRRNIKRKEASDDATKRGHVGKTWVDGGRTYSPDEAKSRRAKMTDGKRQALYRVANDPDDDSPDDDHYPASKTTNPKKLRKQRVMGEIGESYDLYDVILEYLLDEAITSEKGKAKAKEMIASRTTPSGRAKPGQGASVAQIRHIGRSNREGLGGTPMTPTMAKNPIKKKNYTGTGNKAARRAGTYSRFGYQESYDLYDIILSHLIDEGYADTQEAAEVMIANMSEEWREDILNEGIGSAIKSLFGKKKKPEAPAPQSRGAELRAKYNTGPEKTETSVKRKILDKTRERAERDEKEYGDSTYSKSVATKSKAAHDRYLKAGYSKYGADRPDSGGMGGSGGSGRGNKARKRAAALNASYEPDLFDVILEYLITEGYADTNENALVIMANMSEDWRESILLDESGLSQDTIQRAVIARQKRNDAALAKDTPEGDAEYEKGRVKVKRSKSQLDINKKFSREGPTVRIQ